MSTFALIVVVEAAYAGGKIASSLATGALCRETGQSGANDPLANVKRTSDLLRSVVLSRLCFAFVNQKSTSISYNTAPSSCSSIQTNHSNLSWTNKDAIGTQNLPTTPTTSTPLHRHRLTWRICLQRWMLGRFTYPKLLRKTGSLCYSTLHSCCGLKIDLPHRGH